MAQDFTPEYYAYSVTFNITAGAVAPAGSQTIQTQVDAPFIAERLKYWFIDSAVATETVTPVSIEIPDIDLQITDSATSKQFFFTPVPIALVASNNAQFPADLPVSRKVIAGASLTFQYTSTKTFALGYRLVVMLEGYKALPIR